MKKYFYTDGKQKFGPFDIEELGHKNIKKETLIWYEGLPDWTHAGDLEELSLLIATSPPPVPDVHRQSTATGSTQGSIRNQAEAARPDTVPKTWLLESILVTIFCCMPLGIVGIINAARVEARYSAGDYAAALRASREAGTWTKVGFWIGFGVLILYALMILVGVFNFDGGEYFT